MLPYFQYEKNINEGHSPWSVKSIVDFFNIKNCRCIFEFCIKLQTQNFTVIEVCYKKTYILSFLLYAHFHVKDRFSKFVQSLFLLYLYDNTT